MRPVRIALKGGQLLAGKAWATEDVSERIRGFLGRDSIEEGEGLLISPCASLHTMGMRVSLDAVFLDESLRVRKVVRSVRPGKLAWGTLTQILFSWKSQALELPEGAAKDLKPGDQLEVQDRLP
jgi:uncharacterized membrane protein (UPF0127 family)